MTRIQMKVESAKKALPFILRKDKSKLEQSSQIWALLLGASTHSEGWIDWIGLKSTAVFIISEYDNRQWLIDNYPEALV